MFINIIIFDLKRAIRNKKNWIILVVFSILLATYILLYSSSDNALDNIKFLTADNIQCENIIERYNGLYESETNEKLKKTYLDAINISRSMIENNDKLIEAIENKDKKLKNKYDIVYAKLMNERTLNSSNLGRKMQYLEEYVNKNNYIIEFNSYLNNNNITPIYLKDAVGYNFLLITFKKLMPFIVILLPLLLCADCMSNESDSGSFKCLLLQPISRGKIILCRVISSSIISVIFIALPILMVFGIINIVNGTGDPNYPVLYDSNSYKTFEPIFETPGRTEFVATIPIGDLISDSRFVIGISDYYSEFVDHDNSIPNEELTFIGIKDFITLTIPVLVICTIFNSVIAVLISSVAQNSVLSIVFCSIVGILSSMSINLVSSSQILSKFSPYYYGKTVAILGGMGIQTMLSGIAILISYSLILTCFASTLFKKKDVV